MAEQRYQHLLKKYLMNLCTPEEMEELYTYLQQADWDKALVENIQQEFLNGEADQKHKISDHADVRIRKELEAYARKTKRKSWYMSRKVQMLYMAAALVLIIIFIGFYKGSIEDRNVQATKIEQSEQDIVAGGNRAFLTLADGSKIILDEAKQGILSQQGNSIIKKTSDGQIVYESVDEVTDFSAVNTITTPFGGQYQIVLPDGTKVWLNAASSLTFPAVFDRNERRVELTGEGYFEVAKKDGIPFKVFSENQSVEVLGTHFNINAYSDEKIVKTTLLEGSIKVSHLATHRSRILTPGQQSRIDQNIYVVHTIPADEVAWKDGYFKFNRADIKTVMNQLSRWYNVDVEFQGEITNDVFQGRIKRNKTLFQVLEILKLGNVNLNIEGRKIIVSNK